MGALRRQRLPQRLNWVVLAAFLACLGALATMATTAVAVREKPVVTSLSVKPAVLPASGGEITISGRVRNAMSCTIYSKGLGRAVIVRCASGRISFRRHVPANTGMVPVSWSMHVQAHNGHESSYSKDAEVKVPPEVAPSPPVRGLDACALGPECDYGAAYESFPTWDNVVGPGALHDCTFAAAANWEQIVLGVHANPTSIGNEFVQAGGTEGGLSQSALWAYWQQDGIAGIYITEVSSFNTSRIDVENGVRDHTAMIAELSFIISNDVGEDTASGEMHDIVVDGFTPMGPLVVSWGETIQMTWEHPGQLNRIGRGPAGARAVLIANECGWL
jgi:hypothetical protein